MKHKIDKNVTLLGWVSLFASVSGQMIYPLLPLFVTSALGVGTAFLGLLEGIAGSTAGIVKLLSGWYADKLKRRKPLMIAGYVLSTIGKPFLFIAAAGWHVLLVRFVDHIGKGLCTPPRDALIADSTLPAERGLSFGIQKAMERFGAVIGPIAAFAILMLTRDNVRLVFLLAVVPLILAVAILVFFVRERYVLAELPEPPHAPGEAPFTADYKRLMVIVAVFTLGNSSDMFLVLRARALGVGVSWLPILWLMYNLVCSLSAAPLGELSDRIGRKRTLLLGFAVYSAVYFGFGFAARELHIWISMAVYGVYFGLSEGVLRAWVADMVTDESRLATAYGILNMVEGITILPASIIMGLLYQFLGPKTAFSFGAGLALAAALGLVLFIRRRPVDMRPPVG